MNSRSRTLATIALGQSMAQRETELAEWAVFNPGKAFAAIAAVGFGLWAIGKVGFGGKRGKKAAPEDYSDEELEDEMKRRSGANEAVRKVGPSAYWASTTDEARQFAAKKKERGYRVQVTGKNVFVGKRH